MDAIMVMLKGAYERTYGEKIMMRTFTLDYWIDDGWYVGKLREVPGIFSQGETLEALKQNIQDAFMLMVQEVPPIPKQENRHRFHDTQKLRKVYAD